MRLNTIFDHLVVAYFLGHPVCFYGILTLSFLSLYLHMYFSCYNAAFSREIQ